MTKEFDARNAEKSRAVCEAMAERADTGKRVLTERERRILDMWPRFEDGELVMPGDKVHYASAYNDETEIEVESITAMDGYFVLCDDECRSNQYEQGQRVKRPAPKVLDADGVEIKAGDTVWRKGKPTEYKVAIVIDGVVYLTYKTSNGDNSTTTIFARKLTHTRPDSWELWEQDLRRGETCEEACDELIRRAKALAGVEVSE